LCIPSLLFTKEGSPHTTAFYYFFQQQIKNRYTLQRLVFEKTRVVVRVFFIHPSLTGPSEAKWFPGFDRSDKPKVSSPLPPRWPIRVICDIRGIVWSTFVEHLTVLRLREELGDICVSVAKWDISAHSETYSRSC
jgi:hypothetical protein